MTTFRIHIKPQGGRANREVSFAYCFEKQVLGVGWQLEDHRMTATWEEYEHAITASYSDRELSRVRYLKNNVRKDDLIWTRNGKANYFLAKVESEWEYRSDSNARDADIVNIVRCKILPVPSLDDVPGKVIASFRPPRTIQAIRDKTANNYSKYLWNKLSNSTFFDIANHEFENIYSFLDSDETEDVIFVYLQEQGWVVIPNSRKADTMRYEFYLINRKSKERAVVQVKTGNSRLVPKDWERKDWEGEYKVFLFQANSIYEGCDGKNVECIDPKTIETFMRSNRDILPSSINHWIDVAEKERSS